jgi:hypothetical protein
MSASDQSKFDSRASFLTNGGKPEQEMVEHSRGLDPINEFDEAVVIAEGNEKVSPFIPPLFHR